LFETSTTRTTLEKPLPDYWVPQLNRRVNQTYYFNLKTGQISEEHPRTKFFEDCSSSPRLIKIHLVFRHEVRSPESARGASKSRRAVAKINGSASGFFIFPPSCLFCCCSNGLMHLMQVAMFHNFLFAFDLQSMIERVRGNELAQRRRIERTLLIALDRQFRAAQGSAITHQ
jgi:hypothetical protein